MSWSMQEAGIFVRCLIKEENIQLICNYSWHNFLFLKIAWSTEQN